MTSGWRRRRGAIESEGRKCREAGKLLHAWAKLWAERKGETKAAAARMLFKWTTELDFRGGSWRPRTSPKSDLVVT